MGSFLLRRGLASLLVLLVLSFVTYGLIGLMPGDPIDIMVSSNPDLSPEDAARLKALQGLDQPLLARYGRWLAAALSGDLGYSRGFSRPVTEILLPRLGNSLLLLGLSLVLALAIAIPLGLIAARRPGGLVDSAINLTAFAGISVPPFWLAILLILVFAVALGWLPAGGLGQPDDPLDRLRHLLLPLLALTLASVGGFLRFLRASAIQALRQDYVRTARAKGLGEGRILVGHVLRNAALPLTTIIALNLGNLVSGALVTETLFAWPGMGKTIYDAILGNDYNLALAGLMLASFATLIGNLLADLAYNWLDPRIELS